MNDFKVLHWIAGLWLAVLILVACNRVVPASMSNTSVPTLSVTRLSATTPTPLAPGSTPTNSILPTSTPPPSPTTPLPLPDTPTPQPLPSTDTSPANEVAPTGLEPEPMNEPFEVNFVQAQPNPYWKTYTPEDDRLGGVNAFLIDEAGRKWIGSYNGLSIFDGRTWHFYTSANGLPRDSIIQDSVTALARDPAGYTWIGYSGGGLSRFDGQHWQHYTLALDMVGNSVRDLAVDQTGRLWFSTGYSLGMFDGQTWTLYQASPPLTGIPSPPLEPPANAPLIKPQIIEIGPDHPAYAGASAITIDPSGSVWITSAKVGLGLFNGQQWRSYPLDAKYLNDPEIVVDTTAGQVWVASYAGVSVFVGQSWSHYTQTNGLPRDAISAIAIDSAGRKWIGTNVGTTVFDGRIWQTYTQADGLPTRSISAVAIDSAGHVWLATSTGALAEFIPPASPTPLPAPASQVVPRIIDFSITPTSALTVSDVISVTWQAVGEQAEICFLSGTPNFCQPAPVSGSRAITVDETLLTWAISGLWLKVAANGDSTGIFGELNFQCRYKSFYDAPSAGCPETEPIYSRGVAQYFEHGLMIWSEQPDRFYVFFDEDHQFTWFDAEWVKESSFLATPKPLPTPTGIIPTPTPWPTTPPPAAFEPVGGFGRVWQHFWRYDEHGLPVTVRQDIGWAAGSEFEFETAYQCALGTAAYGRWGCSVRGPGGAVFNFSPISTIRDRWVWQEVTAP